jgi:hypothetical protein
MLKRFNQTLGATKPPNHMSIPDIKTRKQLFCTMPFAKIFFRLRRRGAKPRLNGHYWVSWCYDAKMKNVWRIAFYNADTQKYYIPGDRREFDESDFLAIRKWPTVYPMTTITWCVLIYSAIASGFGLALMVINLVHTLNNHTK